MREIAFSESGNGSQNRLIAQRVYVLASSDIGEANAKRRFVDS